jgi:hypothetical protein
MTVREPNKSTEQFRSVYFQVFAAAGVFRGIIMARTCIFCGAPANSREDIWPRWLTSRFIAPGTMEAERRPELQMTTWRVDRPELVVKRVCSQCNNGWMSRLQGRGKHVIDPICDQVAVTLDLEDCQALALWAVMTSLALQTLGEEENWLYSWYKRTSMCNSRRIPSFIGIWIANCIGHTETYSQSRSMWSGPSRESQRQARGNAITMAFGKLAIQVLKVVPDGEIGPLKEITVGQGYGDWENIALQIWPLEGDPVTWPPLRGIRHETELELFTERFRSQVDAPQRMAWPSSRLLMTCPDETPNGGVTLHVQRRHDKTRKNPINL